MASTVPAKSNNPLHNFDLPHLQWNKNHHHHTTTTHHHHHQRRRSSSKLSSDSSSPSPHRLSQSHSPMRDSLPPPDRDPLAPARHSPLRDSLAPARHSPLREPFRPESSHSVAAARHSPMRDSIDPVRRSPMRDSVSTVRQSPMRDTTRREFVPPLPTARESPVRYESGAESDKDRSVIEYRRQPRDNINNNNNNNNNNNSKVLEATDASGNKEGIRSKILIKIPRKTNKADEIHEDQNEVTAAADEEEAIPKTWNLRPRKPIHKSLNINGSAGPFRSTGSSMQDCKSQPPHTMNVSKPLAETNVESNAAQKKEKRQRFSIVLSREEIDEDFYALTGSKAARRPKKRVKLVQKQLDTLFPGLWLASITPDSYKVCENLPKG